MPSSTPRWCSSLFIPRAFAIWLSTFMVLFAIYFFMCVKLNFLVFLPPFISCTCFTWWHLCSAETLITYLTCKLRGQQKARMEKRVPVFVKNSYSVLCSLTAGLVLSIPFHILRKHVPMLTHKNKKTI